MTDTDTALRTAIDAARQDVVDKGRQLLRSSMTVGSWGNLSCRINEGMVAITPSGMGYEAMEPEDVIIVDMEGNVLEGEHIPSSEMPLHLAIYKEFSEARGIVHTHSLYASSLAVARKFLPPIVEDLAQIVGGTVRCSRYAYPGTPEVGEAVVEAMDGGHRAALMANHGAVCWGNDLQEALTTAEVLEKGAQIYCIASQMGTAFPLAREAVEEMHTFYLDHYAKRQKGEE